MSKYRTPQEAFWAGEFGDDYIDRNRSGELLASNTAMFAKILGRTKDVTSVMEFGANIGLNLKAISTILPSVELSAVEINAQAAEELQKRLEVKVYRTSILDYSVDYERDLVLLKGVLIHLNPDCLDGVYEKIYRTSKRYICVAEYYSAVPMEIPYRGHRDRLFKRDFAAEIMEKFKKLKLLDYGFVYHKDPNFPQDDITWFLMEKAY